jgi:hypothetical protein
MNDADAASLFSMENLRSLLLEHSRAGFFYFFRFVYGIKRSQVHI